MAAVLAALLAACTPPGQRASQPSRPVTLRGRLVQVRTTRLTVHAAAEERMVQVTFAPAATPIYAVSRSTTGAIQPGTCVAATGQLDATGAVIATALMVAASVDDTCPASAEPPPPPSVGAGSSPSPSSLGVPPSPSPAPGAAVLRGQVLSVGGGAVAVEHGGGEPVVIRLSHDVDVLFFQPGGRGSLVVPTCVVIDGIRTGQVVAARRIVDWPLGTEC